MTERDETKDLEAKKKLQAQELMVEVYGILNDADRGKAPNKSGSWTEANKKEYAVALDNATLALRHVRSFLQ